MVFDSGLQASLKNSEAAWQKMIGADKEDLHATIEKEEDDLSKLTEPTHGITDPTGAPHVGGGMFAGGVGTVLKNHTNCIFSKICCEICRWFQYCRIRWGRWAL